MAGTTESESSSIVNRTKFKEFCDKQFPPDVGCRTLRKERCAKIVRYLQGLEPAPQGSWRYRIEKKGYTLVNFPTLGLKDVLCVKRTVTDGMVEQGKYKHWRRVVPVEEFYDVLLDTHVRIQKHGGYKNLLKSVQLNYIGIPREAAIKFVSLCCVCQNNTRQRCRTAKAIEANRERLVKVACTTDAFNVRAQVDVINMGNNLDGDYTHLGMYMDHWTSFITLFPMIGNSAEHVAYGLASSVFPYFGPPRILHSPEGKEFATQVIQLSMGTWKGGEKTAMPQGKPGLEQLGKVMEEARTNLIQRIDDRAVAEKVEAPLPWARWLGKIMFDMNSEVNREMGRSPYSRVFERAIGMPEVGEPREPLKDIAYVDRRHREGVVAPEPVAEVAGQEGHLTVFIDTDATQGQQYLIQETPVIIQADAASTQIVLAAEEADSVLPVAATEVFVDNQMPEERQSFTTTYVDPSGGVQNFIINVEPADR